jgi:hypothetical protein
MTEHESIEGLLKNATKDVPGPDANRELYEARADIIDRHGNAVLYEFVVKEAEPWSDLLRQRMPSMRSYLDGKGIKGVPGLDVLIGAWYRQRLFLFEGPTFWESVARMENLSTAELDAMLRRDPDQKVLFLPPPEPGRGR